MGVSQGEIDPKTTGVESVVGRQGSTGIWDHPFKRHLSREKLLRSKKSLNFSLETEALRDKRKRDKSIGEAVFERGYTQREVADHLRIHFTSVSRILRAKGRMLKK